MPHYPREDPNATAEDGQTQRIKDGQAMRDRVLETFAIQEWALFEPS